MQVVGPIVGAALAMQSVVWILLYELFGVVRVGYSFFDLSDIIGTYYPYAVYLSRGMVAFRDFFIEYPPLFVPLLAACASTPLARASRLCSAPATRIPKMRSSSDSLS